MWAVAKVDSVIPGPTSTLTKKHSQRVLSQSQRNLADANNQANRSPRSPRRAARSPGRSPRSPSSPRSDPSEQSEEEARLKRITAAKRGWASARGKSQANAMTAQIKQVVKVEKSLQEAVANTKSELTKSLEFNSAGNHTAAYESAVSAAQEAVAILTAKRAPLNTKDAKGAKKAPAAVTQEDLLLVDHAFIHAAALCEVRGDLTGAEEWLKKSSDVRKRLFGPKDDWYGGTLNRLGEFYLRTNQVDERAVRALSECLVLAVENHKTVNGHRAAQRVASNLAAVYNQLGRFEEARELLKDVVRARANCAMNPDDSDMPEEAMPTFARSDLPLSNASDFHNDKAWSERTINSSITEKHLMWYDADYAKNTGSGPA